MAMGNGISNAPAEITATMIAALAESLTGLFHIGTTRFLGAATVIDDCLTPHSLIPWTGRAPQCVLLQPSHAHFIVYAKPHCPWAAFEQDLLACVRHHTTVRHLIAITWDRVWSLRCSGPVTRNAVSLRGLHSASRQPTNRWVSLSPGLDVMVLDITRSSHHPTPDPDISSANRPWGDIPLAAPMITKDQFRSFFNDLFPLMRLRREIAGRASLVRGRVVVHYLVVGSEDSISPELSAEVGEGACHVRFHTHPRCGAPGYDACWPSIEDLADAQSSFTQWPELRYDAVATACGIVVIQRAQPRFQELLNDKGTGASPALVAAWNARDLYESLFRVDRPLIWTPQSLSQHLLTHGLEAQWLPTGNSITDAEIRRATMSFTPNDTWLDGLYQWIEKLEDVKPSDRKETASTGEWRRLLEALGPRFRAASSDTAVAIRLALYLRAPDDQRPAMYEALRGALSEANTRGQRLLAFGRGLDDPHDWTQAVQTAVTPGVYVLPVGSVLYHATSGNFEAARILERDNFFGDFGTVFFYFAVDYQMHHEHGGVVHRYLVRGHPLRLLALDDAMVMRTLLATSPVDSPLRASWPLIGDDAVARRWNFNTDRAAARDALEQARADGRWGDRLDGIATTRLLPVIGTEEESPPEVWLSSPGEVLSADTEARVVIPDPHVMFWRL